MEETTLYLRNMAHTNYRANGINAADFSGTCYEALKALALASTRTSGAHVARPDGTIVAFYCEHVGSVRGTVAVNEYELGCIVDVAEIVARVAS